VGFGDEVITSGFTFVATWEAILECGAVPVFVGIDDTLNLDPKALPGKITPRTKAVIPVHMLGAQARIEEIMAVADQHHIPVIEDTAQASGFIMENLCSFKYRDLRFGNTMTGEGGMLIVDDPGYRWASNTIRSIIGPTGVGGRSFIGFNFSDDGTSAPLG
jgi:8-amino-3,8-dideoxy-alpha-D-manno-octulosonate transaminase